MYKALKKQKSADIATTNLSEVLTESNTRILQSLGVDLTDSNYTGTPQRVTEFLMDFTQSLRNDITPELESNFEAVFTKHKHTSKPYRGMLVQSPIRVYSLCSHHFLPVIYDIAFGYIPKEVYIGFSKITRVLKILARKPANQEDFTQEIVDIFSQKLRPQGLAVVVSGTHMCMKMRGIESDALNLTSAVVGDFKNYERTKDEFLSLATNFRLSS